MTKKIFEIKGNACAGKVRYESFSSANKQVGRQNNNKNTRKMKSYKCGECGGYHYGHDQRKKMKNQTKPTYIPPYDDSDIKPHYNQNEFLNIKLNN